MEGVQNGCCWQRVAGLSVGALVAAPLSGHVYESQPTTGLTLDLPGGSSSSSSVLWSAHPSRPAAVPPQAHSAVHAPLRCAAGLTSMHASRGSTSGWALGCTWVSVLPGRASQSAVGSG